MVQGLLFGWQATLTHAVVTAALGLSLAFVADTLGAEGLPVTLLPGLRHQGPRR